MRAWPRALDSPVVRGFVALSGQVSRAAGGRPLSAGPASRLAGARVDIEQPPSRPPSRRTGNAVGSDPRASTRDHPDEPRKSTVTSIIRAGKVEPPCSVILELPLTGARSRVCCPPGAEPPPPKGDSRPSCSPERCPGPRRDASHAIAGRSRALLELSTRNNSRGGRAHKCRGGDRSVSEQYRRAVRTG